MGSPACELMQQRRATAREGLELCEIAAHVEVLERARGASRKPRSPWGRAGEVLRSGSTEKGDHPVCLHR